MLPGSGGGSGRRREGAGLPSGPLRPREPPTGSGLPSSTARLCPFSVFPPAGSLSPGQRRRLASSSSRVYQAQPRGPREPSEGVSGGQLPSLARQSTRD